MIVRAHVRALASNPSSPQVLDDLAGCVVARCTGDAASRVGARTAQVKARERQTVIGVPKDGAQRIELVEAELAVEQIAVDQPEALFQIKRAQHLAGNDTAGEVWCVLGYGRDDSIGECFLFSWVRPVSRRRQVRRDVLYEQTCDMLACRRERRIERRGDQHFDNRCTGPAVTAGVDIGTLQIRHTRPDDDAGAMVVLLVSAGARKKIRKLGQRDVHAKRARARLDRAKPAVGIGVDIAFGHEIAEQQLRRNMIAMAAPAIWFATGVQRAIEFLSSRLPEVAETTTDSAALVLLLVVPLAHFPMMDRSDTRLADSFARTVLENLPPGAVLFVTGDNQVGPFGYLHHVEGLRSDIELRSWNNTVYSNRLGSPLLPEDERDRLIARYVAESGNPVFSVPRRIRPHQDHGAYVRVGKQGGIVPEPAFAQWLDYALVLYENGLARETHERRFLHERLTDFSDMLIRDGHLQIVNLPAPWVQLRNRLMQTFPGQLALLEVAVDSPVVQENLPQLAGLIRAAEQRLPPHAGDTGRFYFHAGRVALMQEDCTLAQGYFKRSIDYYPREDNESHSALKSLAESSTTPSCTGQTIH